MHRSLHNNSTIAYFAKMPQGIASNTGAIQVIDQNEPNAGVAISSSASVWPVESTTDPR